MSLSEHIIHASTLNLVLSLSFLGLLVLMTVVTIDQIEKYKD